MKWTVIDTSSIFTLEFSCDIPFLLFKVSQNRMTTKKEAGFGEEEQIIWQYVNGSDP